jgi:intracellular multiplication protein IcmO
MARRYVEAQHEATLASRVIDVRPASAIYAEWLSQKANFLMIAVAHLVLALVSPWASMIAVPSLLVHVVIYTSTKALLPFRYPAGDKGKTPKPSIKSDGIMLMGSLESDNEYEEFKEVWQSDDDLRKHFLILGSTGSGKSESLKGIFFNALCWSSGFFVADGKADNKLPTDSHNLARSFGRDDDVLLLNFLLAGSTPEAVRKSRRRRTNGINPVALADADTTIQMGANLLPKVEGEGKNWQEKALNLWRAVVVAICYKRDNQGMDISVSTLIDYLALPKVEELYLEGYHEAQARGEWSYGFTGIKAYLESGCPAYKIDKLMAKHGLGDAPAPAPGRAAATGAKQFEQDSMAFEQHAYRTSQLMPVLNLLDKTYGYIFRDKYPEIDMIDVTLNNRILAMLIPSLEKSAAEAENLGKLAIACLRVMMGKNLGAEVEGTREELLSSKATTANYPYIVSLDELAYYFSDGVAVMFAQARSLGFCMIAAAQDLEKLTEGNRAAEAGAMLANSVAKFFMRIDDAGKTYEFIQKILGKVEVAVKQTYELATFGFKRSKEISIQQVDRVSLTELQSKGAGQGVFNSAGKTVRVKSFYVGDFLNQYKVDDFWVLRFLQVEPPSDEEADAMSIPIDQANDRVQKGARMLSLLRHQVSRSADQPHPHPAIEAVAKVSRELNEFTNAAERAITLYQAARAAVLALEAVPAPLETADVAAAPPTAAAASGGGVAVAERAHVAAAAEAEPTKAAGDEPIDPLAFLDAGPYQRKSAESLLRDAHGDALRSEGASLGETAIPEKVNAVDRFFQEARTLSVRRAGQEPAEAAPSAGTLMALAGTMLSAGQRPPLSDAQSWIEQACDDSMGVLAAASDAGKTVVAFTNETFKSVSDLEAVLGAADPAASAGNVERVVSSIVTPNITPTEQSLRLEDITEFFDQLQNLDGKN